MLLLLLSQRKQVWNWINKSSPLLELLGGTITFVFCFFSVTTWALVSTSLILWDSIKPKTSNCQFTKTTHHYYNTTTSGEKQQLLLFEQSLDVYQPTTLSDSNNNDSKPIIVLVVGSGWAGHKYLISMASNWWNSSGPQMIIRDLKTKCICIRHRGGFPKFPYQKVVALVAGINFVLYLYNALSDDVQTADNNYSSSWHLHAFITTILVIYDGILRWAAQGAATVDDMMEDVTVALKWIHDNHYAAGKRPIWFGGYSSGGHVASLVLQNPQLVLDQQVVPLEEWIQKFVFVSGVMGVRPPSPSPTTITKKDAAATITPPRFVTEFVNQTIFGEQAAKTLPSPVEELAKAAKEKQAYPKVPHLLIGCQNEFMGLTWLDYYFKSEEYHQTLAKEYPKISSKYVSLPTTNHWEVLSSRELKDALEKELQLEAKDKDS